MKHKLRPPGLQGALIFGLVLAALGATGRAGRIAKHQLSLEQRKTIVFDLKTPKVFYCPQEKPADPEKLIVKARPLEKLCQFEGKPRPRNQPSDCYNDVDETEFACDEKRRFMVSISRVSKIRLI